MAQWCKTLNAPEFGALVGCATQSNLDLRLAVERVLEARAWRGVTAADLWPTINVSSADARNRCSENEAAAQAGPVNASTAAGAAAFGKLNQDLFQTGFDSSWEVDLFGGVRRSIQAADADLAASVEDLCDVWVTLLAEIVRNYVEVCGFQRRITIA